MKRYQYEQQFDSLQRIFADITDNAKRDPIERIVVLTYEFDDQQLVNLIAGRPLDDNFELHTNPLRFIAACQPVVLYDARKTRESNQLPHFLDLIPVKSAAFSCHHAKAYLVLTRNAVRLVLGSFNLTHTGLFSNREVFKEFAWDKERVAEGAILHGVIDLLRNGYASHAQARESAALQSVCATLEQRAAAWGVTRTSGKYTLLASGYGQASGLAQLAARWRSMSSTPPVRVLAVSPFFDRGRRLLVQALEQELGPIGTLEIVSDAKGELSQAHFDCSAQARHAWLIAPELSEQERARIVLANGGEKLPDIDLKRKLHAKILVLCGEDGRHLVYAGSANFTCKAWNGDNQELGLLWEEGGDAQQLLQGIRRSLSASAECSYERLPPALAPSESEEDPLYTVDGAYPDFIERIVLEQDSAGQGLRFRFVGQQLERLAHYAIHWGEREIVAQDGMSQTMPLAEARLPDRGKRNLRFVASEAPGLVYFMPFYHEAALAAQADLLLFPRPEDWLLHYLNPAQYQGGSPDEALPGETPPAPVPEQGEVDREANAVIAMQRYLSLFSAVEAVFAERAQEVAGSPDRAARYQRHIDAPLRLYADILQRAHAADASDIGKEAYLFKQGELALFCGELHALLPEARALAADMAARLRTPGARSAALGIYLEFCMKELA